MSMGLLGVAVLILSLTAPSLLEVYLRQLPVAPTCPSCRSVARQIAVACSFSEFLPALNRTFKAECPRCGWRGRMRLKLATLTNRRR